MIIYILLVTAVSGIIKFISEKCKKRKMKKVKINYMIKEDTNNQNTTMEGMIIPLYI